MDNPSTQSWSAGEPEKRIAENAGEWIGPYKLLEVIGEGGFGVVWRAERREPFVQRVALKIIKPGMDTKVVIARFEQERQALAVMDHPNVAKVLDGGSTPLGRPYFVMEYVKGEPINTFCDRHMLTLRQRLDLFLPVCDAVQHAHHKGIIHRDLKPSNILVAIPDRQHGTAAPATTTPADDAVVKVIDFGVAKAVNHTLTDKTVFTETGHLIGTPEYMSPEQAEMGRLDVDTRTDVYSLGVVLYELLAGVLPFDSRDLRSRGYAEIQRIIREVEPPTPSKRLTSLGGEEVARIAKLRHAQREQLAETLRKELEWIPIKAIRKERDRRYQSPADLAEDIRRFIRGEPLSAGPESAAYRFKKFARRRRTPLTIAALFVAALLAGITTTTWAMVQESKARDRAERAQLREAEHRKAAEEALDFIRNTFKSISPSQRGPNVTVLSLFQAGAPRIDQIRKDGSPASSRVAGQVHRIYGEAFRTVNLYPESIRELSTAIDLLTIGDAVPASEQIAMLTDLALNCLDAGDYTGARRAATKAEQIHRAAGADPSVTPQAGRAIHDMWAWYHHETGDDPIAEFHYRAAAGDSAGLALLLAQTGDGPAARRLIDAALAETRAKRSDSTAAAFMLIIRARARIAQGDTAGAADDLAEARNLYARLDGDLADLPTRENADMQLTAFAEDYPDKVNPSTHKPAPGPISRFKLGALELQRPILYRDRARQLYREQRTTDAEKLFQLALESGETHPDPITRLLVTAHTQAAWAESLRAAGRADEARLHADQALAAATDARLDPADAAVALLTSARVASDRRQFADAKTQLDRLRAIWSAQLPPGAWPLAIIDAESAFCDAALAPCPGCAARLAAALAGVQKELGPSHPITLRLIDLRSRISRG